MTAPFRPERGWVGHFTRDQAAGAMPNGTRVRKSEFKPGDAHPIGALATVIGSIRAPVNGEDQLAYFVEFDDLPKHAVGIMPWRIEEAPTA